MLWRSRWKDVGFFRAFTLLIRFKGAWFEVFRTCFQEKPMRTKLDRNNVLPM